jgi:SAM-dependent methyltransferase
MNPAAPDAVRAFYSAHPYPPPVDNLDRARDEWRDANRHRADFHLLWPDRPFRADLDILVAGCGTWQAAKYAVCRPEARVTGIDVSTTSLDRTEQLKRKYSLTNLATQLLPIEEVGGLARRFDLIVCTGVLHHLADPDAGLRALRSVLKPEGAIYLMVYAPYGRSGIYMLQDYCRRLGIGTSADEINDLVSVVEALPRHHPLKLILSASRDFQNPDAIADALLNPRDRSYSVPELLDAVTANGLSFVRWYWQAPYLPQCGAIAATPHAHRLGKLTAAEQWAAMELWRGTMMAHSLLIGRDDGAPHVPIGFDDEHWKSYVPIRLPSTLCIQERLPAGAAGVLLNRSHPFHDLILPIGAPEKRMLDAIDGGRTIEEIADVAGGDDAPSRGRAFFEKLWCYDQVTFDASTAQRSRERARHPMSTEEADDPSTSQQFEGQAISRPRTIAP